MEYKEQEGLLLGKVLEDEAEKCLDPWNRRLDDGGFLFERCGHPWEWPA